MFHRATKTKTGRENPVFALISGQELESFKAAILAAKAGVLSLIFYSPEQIFGG